MTYNIETTNDLIVQLCGVFGNCIFIVIMLIIVIYVNEKVKSEITNTIIERTIIEYDKLKKKKELEWKLKEETRVFNNKQRLDYLNLPYNIVWRNFGFRYSSISFNIKVKSCMKFRNLHKFIAAFGSPPISFAHPVKPGPFIIINNLRQGFANYKKHNSHPLMIYFKDSIPCYVIEVLFHTPCMILTRLIGRRILYQIKIETNAIKYPDTIYHTTVSRGYERKRELQEGDSHKLSKVIPNDSTVIKLINLLNEYRDRDYSIEQIEIIV